MAINLACLDPKYMIEHAATSRAKFEKVLRVLVDNNHVDERKCDPIVVQYSNCLKLNVLKDFDSKLCRLDTFWHSAIGNDNDFAMMWSCVFHKLLLLSHGQASVERGFSINKDVISENQHPKTLVARRLCKQFVSQCGGISKVVVNSDMLLAARSARGKYMAHLEEENEKKKEETRKRKAKIIKI